MRGRRAAGHGPAHLQEGADQAARAAPGRASRVARLHLVGDAPSLDKGEVTDKGSINQRAVLAHRAALVEALHTDGVQPIFKPVSS